MSKALYKIGDIIDTTSNAWALTGTSPLDSENTSVTMCSSSDVLEEIDDSFGERSIYIKETETPFVSFTAMWTRWLARRGNMLAAAWQALHTEYSPLENYDRLESGTDTKTITPAETTRTITPAETTNTITPAETTNTEAITAPGKTSVKADTFNAFNSAAPVATTGSTITENGETTNALEVNTAGSEALTVQQAGTESLDVDTAGSEALTVQHAGSEAVTVQHDGKEKLEVDASGEEKTEYGHRVRGNIGVTTSQQMAESELHLREKDFVYGAICEFIQLYTIYV